MPIERISTRPEATGYVESVGDYAGYNQDAIWFEIHEYTRSGNIRRTVRVTLNLFDAARVAKLVSKAFVARDQHTARLRSIASGEGF